MVGDFELLLAKDCDQYYSIIGITYSNAMLVEPDCVTLRATLFTIEECKKELSAGKRITVNKHYEYPEIQPNDLIIEAVDELERHKLMAINEISSRMHQALFTVSVIDLMDYLANYIELLNAGYYITDSNREDKYFEIIEHSQMCEEPEPLTENSTFEEEQEYIDKKQKYTTAQKNLSTLEKYLNSYDKLTHLKTITDFLTTTRKNIENAESIDEINKILTVYKSNLINYKIVKV